MIGPVRLSKNEPEFSTIDTPDCGCAIWCAASMRRKCSAASCGVGYEININVASPLDVLYRAMLTSVLALKSTRSALTGGVSALRALGPIIYFCVFGT